MSAIALVICWNDSAAPELVERMLDRVDHQAVDGRWLAAEKNCALGFARLATMARERQETQPYYDSQRGLWIVADLRLDNRAELGALLCGGADRAPSDVELVGLGFARWGVELAEHLVGDFALALWDCGSQTAYLARDPFGVRPLYYQSSARRLAVASEIEQLLALQDGGIELEDGAVLDFLTGEYRQVRETFFRKVLRVLPGHWLAATPDRLHEGRYWRPPAKAIRLARTEDYHGEFRRLFQQAVAARLDSDRPITAQLSGGLDSSAIVCTADALYAADNHRPPLVAASAVYPGLDCDETPYIDAVCRRVRFASERWDGTAVGLPDSSLLAHPWGCAQFGTYAGNWYRGLHGAGRVVLSGYGGDELLFEAGIFRDLAAQGRWLALLREAARAPWYSTRTAADWIRDAVRANLPPFIRSTYRRLRPRRPQPPAWLADRLRALWPQRPAAPPDPWAESLPSHTQQLTWTWLTHPRFWLFTEFQTLQAARYGAQLRFPYLDSRLASFVLAIPYEHRLPQGSLKRLVRGGLADLLPAKIARRRGVTTFDSNFRLQFQKSLPRLRELFHPAAHWQCSAYVDRSAVQKILATIDANDPILIYNKNTRNVWTIATLELWLRALKIAGILLTRAAK